MALAGEAHAGEGILLFYNYSTGIATTGQVDANGNYSDLRNFSFDRAWGWITPAGDGLVLFHGSGMAYGSATPMATGQVEADGSFQDLKSLPGSVGGHVFVSPRDGMLLVVNNGNHVATTGRIDEFGNFIPLRTFPGFDEVWTHLVSPGNGLVLFYSSITGNVVIGRVGIRGDYQDLRSYRNFDQWSQIISTSDGILVFYNRATGAAATGRIDAVGNYSDLSFFELRPGGRVVSTTNGWVVFFHGTGAWFGKIGPQGNYISGPYMNGFDSWSEIVSVR